eukprot:4659086-Pleurochrysis_carterae.AAC.1
MRAARARATRPRQETARAYARCVHLCESVRTRGARMCNASRQGAARAHTHAVCEHSRARPRARCTRMLHEAKSAESLRARTHAARACAVRMRERAACACATRRGGGTAPARTPQAPALGALACVLRTHARRVGAKGRRARTQTACPRAARARMRSTCAQT